MVIFIIWTKISLFIKYNQKNLEKRIWKQQKNFRQFIKCFLLKKEIKRRKRYISKNSQKVSCSVRASANTFLLLIIIGCKTMLLHIIFFCSGPLEWGRNYIIKWVFSPFFVQSILADRFNHCRELWMVSLGSPSSVKHGIQSFFHFRFLHRIIEV